MSKFSPFAGILAMGSALGLVLVQQVAAQTAPGDQLEEVVVTAEKRTVDLQKVADSIQVKQGEEMREEGKQRLDEIMAGTVGIQAQDNRLGLTFFVRGVDSSAGNPGVSIISPVAVLVDGVSESRSEVVRGDTVDVSQVEIMRGPQSTTLGANALAGAVSLVANQPVLGKYETLGSIEAGNYAKEAFQGVQNLPISDTMALRLAYSSDKRDGYISSGAGNSDLSTARLKFRWQPNENLNTVFTVQHQEIGGNGSNQNQLLAYGYWVPVTANNTGITQLTSSGCGSTNPAVTIMGCPAAFYTLTGTGPSFRQRPSAWDDGYPANSFVDSPYLLTKVTKVTEKVDWNTAIGTLTVLPAVEFASLDDRENPMGSSYMESHEKETTTTVDVHLNSKAGSGPLSWVLGAYYARDNTYNAWTEFATYPGAVGGPPSGCAPTFPANQTCYIWQDQPSQIRTDLSAYFNLEYSLTARLRAIGGARYWHDDVSQSQQADISGVANQWSTAEQATAAINSGSAQWRHGTFRAGLEFDLQPGTMLYATYSTGYNPGHFAVTAPGGPPGATVSVGDASTLNQIALGWKSRFLENRFQFNGEFFSSTYFNRPIQGTVNGYIGNANASNCFGSFPPSGTLSVTVLSAGSACAIVNQDYATDPKLTSKGLDMDAMFLITRDDRLSFTFEYLKSQYQSLPTFGGASYTPAALQLLNPSLSAADAAVLSRNLAGGLSGFVGASPQNSPLTSATLDFQHMFHLPAGGVLMPHIAAVYKARYWSFGGAPGANVSTIIHDGSNSNDLAWQQPYVTWDAFLEWRSDDGKYNVNGYVRNLTNQVVLQNYTYPYVSIAAPRTVGVILNAHF